MPRPRIKPAGQQNEREPSRASQREAASFVLAAPIAQENKTCRESEKGKCRPGKDRKQPRLGLAEIVHAVSPQKVLMILPLKAADYRGFIQWANSIMPTRLSEDYPTSRLVKFDSDWTPSYLPQGRTITESLRPFFEENGIVLRESYWEKILETNGLRW